MNYKEKYEKAIVHLKKFLVGDCVIDQDILDDFPELEESEDERIRKWLVAQMQKFHDEANREGCWEDFCMTEKAISYLEKQKEHKPIEFKNDELVEIIKGEFEGFRRLLKKKGIDYEPQYSYWEGFARLFDSSAKEDVKEGSMSKSRNP